MMRTFYLLAFIAIAVSCTQRLESPEGGSSSLRLTVTRSDFSESNGSVITRATESKFQDGDIIGVFIHTGATVGSSGNHSSNMKYLTSDAGSSWRAASSLSDGLITGTTYYSTGYYPYKQSGSNAEAIEHSVYEDQSAIGGDKSTNLELSDFMIASASAVTVSSHSSAAVTLGFKHILTKLIVSVGIPAEIDNIKTVGVKSVRINGLNGTCSVNIGTGVVTAKAGTAFGITPRLLSGTGAPGSVSSWEAIVVPQTVGAGSNIVEIVCTMVNGSEKSLSHITASSFALVSGQRTTLSLSSSVDLGFTSTVEFVNGDAKTNTPLGIKAPAGSAWTLTSDQPWLKLSATSGGAYAATITGDANGIARDIYLSIEQNAGALATPRSATLTLSNARGNKMTYAVMQNFTNFSATGSSWAISAGSGQSQAIAAFGSNGEWVVRSVDVSGVALGATISETAAGAALTLPYTGIGALASNALYGQVSTANNSAAARVGKLTIELSGSNPKRVVEIAITQAAPTLALDKTEQNVGSGVTSATFNVTAAAKNLGVTYTPTTGAGATSVSPNSEQTVNVDGTYSGTVTVNFPANADKVSKKTIVATVKYGAGTLTHTITQAAAAPATVIVGGARWTTANLTGTPSSNEGHAVESSPEGYGMFFRWGSLYTYQRASSGSDGAGWSGANTPSDYYRGSSSTPTTQSRNYDYVGLNGLTPGDPCKSLGSYRTPTQTQWAALNAAGTKWGTYNGINGRFFGSNYNSCTNTSIADGCIFLPASGYREWNTGTQAYQGNNGYYWSSSVYDANYGWHCNFFSSGVGPENYNIRSFGFSVRCVDATPAPIEVVDIAGTKWLTTNMTGDASTNTNHRVEYQPQDYGMFFRWGSLYTYQRESSSSDGPGWASGSSNYTRGSSTTPTTQSRNYDYVGLNGLTPGDPCKSLGSYRTPTQAQWAALNTAGTKWGTYNGINGRFFGANYSSCTNTSIADGCIFIPASGYRYWSNGTQNYQGSEGHYWSSSVYDATNGWGCYFNSGYVGPDYSDIRSFGFSVRCVYDAPPVPQTVEIAGTKWVTANLTGDYGTNNKHAVGANPQDKGMFFKWGSTFVYKRASDANEGEGFRTSEYIRGAAQNPTATSTGGTGYDYGAGLSGSTAYAGDPCKKLGSYRTPTRAQWVALNNTGTLWSSYNGIPGRFFGPKASSCNNTTLQDGCIFLPASGDRGCYNGTLEGEGSWGYYWSSSVNDSNYGYHCNFYSGSVYPEYYYVRSYGFSVRCVQE